MLRLLVIHFVVVSRHQQTSLLTSDWCHQLAMVRRGWVYYTWCLQHAMEPDIGSESQHPPAFDASVRGFPSEYRNNVWCEETGMLWLLDGEKILTMWLLVLTESTNVTDRHTYRQTDTAWRHRPRLCIAPLGKNHRSKYLKNRKSQRRKLILWNCART